MCHGCEIRSAPGKGRPGFAELADSASGRVSNVSREDRAGIGSAWREGVLGQGCLRPLKSRYSQSMTVLPVPWSWWRARSASA
jgi:hypothetical protein